MESVFPGKICKAFTSATTDSKEAAAYEHMPQQVNIRAHSPDGVRTMSNLHSPLFACLRRSAGAAALLALIAGLPLPAVADLATTCEKGRITYLEYKGGTYVNVATDNSPATAKQRTSLLANPNIKVTRISWDNGTRWRDRLGLLRMAQALQVPIYIGTWENDCIGGSDDFTITLCSAGNEWGNCG